MDPLKWMGAIKMRVQTAEKSQLNSNAQTQIQVNLMWSEKLGVNKVQRCTF